MAGISRHKKGGRKEMTQIKQIKQSTINRALRLHKKWLDGNDGRRLVVTDKALELIDFSGVNFSSADFSFADFSGANFSCVNFRWANFSSVNFSLADFSFVNLSFADFSRADFSGADFANIHLNYINTINTKGLTVISCQLNTSDENRSIKYWKNLGIVTAGCFSGTLDELKEAVDKKHRNKKALYAKYQSVFEYIDTVLKLEELSDD